MFPFLHDVGIVFLSPRCECGESRSSRVIEANLPRLNRLSLAARRTVIQLIDMTVAIVVDPVAGLGHERPHLAVAVLAVAAEHGAVAVAVGTASTAATVEPVADKGGSGGEE